MSTNPYFDSSFTADQFDQELYDSLVEESIQVHGRDYYYLPRTLSNFNELFGEDVVSVFKAAKKVEMYIENVSGWQGEQQFISKFGLEIRENASLIVSKRRFKEEIGIAFGLSNPREGDIIIFPKELDHRIRFFEISYVDAEPVFYQLGDLYSYRLSVRPFDYNGEQFETGITEIDDYELQYGASEKLELESGTGTFSLGDIITQGNSYTATVLSFDENTKELVVTANESENGTSSSPEFNLPIKSNSGATWTLKQIIDKTEHIGNSDNDIIDNKNIDLIDDFESNPFLG
jgi:hypothetical protein